MSRRAKNWPNLRKRVHPTGRVAWQVDCGERDGKRDRRDFPTKGEAEAYAQQRRIEQENEGIQAPILALEIKLEAARCVEKLSSYGASLTEAVDHYIGYVLVHRTAPTISKMIEDLLTQKQNVAKLRESWVRTLKYFWGKFADRFGDRQLHTLTLDELKSICLEPCIAPRTSLNRRRMISQLYNHALHEPHRWVNVNLAKQIVLPDWHGAEPGVLTVDEFRRLLECAHEFGLLGYVAIGGFAGVRSCEMCRMDWRDVHRPDREIVIGAHIAKTWSRRVVAYGDALDAWLERCAFNAGPIVDVKSFHKNFTALKRAAGIAKWPHNALRHSFASYDLSMHGDAVRTAHLMGHQGGTVMLHSHYKALVSKAEAQKYWALRPAGFVAKPELVTA